MARLFVLPIATRIAAQVAGAGPLHPVLGNQLIRSTSSVALNIAEGAGRFGRDRFFHYLLIPCCTGFSQYMRHTPMTILP